MSVRRSPKIGELLAWLLLATGLAMVPLLARYDRTAFDPAADGRRVIRLPGLPAGPPAGEVPPPAADMREAADRLERAAAAADEARVRLEKTREELDHRKEELESLRVDADVDSRRTRRELAEARQELAARRRDLEEAAEQAEERVAAARQEMEALVRDRQAAAAQAGIARGLGRGSRLEMAAAADPRRFRNPALPPPIANEAAVAAAGAAGRRRDGSNNRAGYLAAGSTAAGDVLRGQAELARARGDYALDTSTAAINAETARGLAVENRLRVVETFFETRRINRINRAFERGPAITPEQAVRLAARGMPRRLTPLELDPVTGDISWPRILQDTAYDAITGEVQSAFRERAARGMSLDFASSERCVADIDRLRADLDGRAGVYPAGEFGRARTFLESLQREAVLPPDL